MTIGGVYTFNITISDSASGTQISSCSSVVEVVQATQLSFSLLHLDSADSREFIDPSIPESFLCVQVTDKVAPMSYLWKVTKKSTGALLYLKALNVGAG